MTKISKQEGEKLRQLLEPESKALGHTEGNWDQKHRMVHRMNNATWQDVDPADAAMAKQSLAEYSGPPSNEEVHVIDVGGSIPPWGWAFLTAIIIFLLFCFFPSIPKKVFKEKENHVSYYYVTMTDGTVMSVRDSVYFDLQRQKRQLEEKETEEKAERSNLPTNTIFWMALAFFFLVFCWYVVTWRKK